MISLSLADVAAVVGGTLVNQSDPSARVGTVVSDSREECSEALFVALEGTRVDGHEFAAQALERGASGVLATRPTVGPTIVVDDVLFALGRLARHHLESLPEVTVIAITGSVGKTTTKDLVAQILEEVGPTVAPPGSYNNELGLPMTVLRADEKTKFLVLEMGARGAGHVEYLCGVAPPNIGVELNVGTAHVGEFGGIDAIARAKAELVLALPADGVAILNADDERVMQMANSTRARVVSFGQSRNATVQATDVASDELDRPGFNLVTPDGSAKVTMGLSGTHLVLDALAAAAVAWVLGVDRNEIARALSKAVTRSAWRMEIQQRPDGVIVINDSYNANPESMRAALRSLKQIGQGHRTWAILGEMRELGDGSASEHDAVGRLAVRLDVQRLLAVGPGARPIHLAAHLEGSWGMESRYVASVEEAVQLVTEEVLPGDVVLVKASRAAGLESLAQALLAAASGNARDGQS